ncbi:TniQ family protein [Streptomyces sp. AV19]|uniref:TniQ family protein n=1 Tax=Streptomyces sp. AV19 TaxID=2793068 RepID=UPI0018FE393D|nr:TniQ family protein [Streptomyces sp. AV19]MBH1935723.1 TniQ family protein [Streptomyces sp. AV19]MDG4536003.1 TniQ family protein [Streptomyces sp. AV19]
MNVTTDPLPRSLQPLPDESLPGFLLRLAHRLDLTPRQVAWRAGLVNTDSPSAKAPASCLLMLESRPLHAFARSARLAPVDADALTLRPYTDRYPALTQALVRPGSTPRPRKVFPPWLLMSYSRYCPACLAGDDTLIQRRHGGPWKRQWRLAITFACLDHQVFLRNHCPDCRLPALGGRPGHLALLPFPSTPGLHPAQCRNPQDRSSTVRPGVCGHRLDSAEPPDIPLTPHLADLQRRLLDLLVSNAPPEHAFRRFADLQVATALIQAGWPAAADLAPTGARAALEAHLAPPQHAGRSPRQTDRALPPPTAPTWTTPPGDAVATAALLAAADHLLAQDPSTSHNTLPDLLRHLPTRQDPRWDTTWRTLSYESSPLFRHHIDQVFRRMLPSDWLRQGAPTQRITKANSARKLFAPTHTLKDLGLDAEYIPQTLPSSWLAAVLGNTDPRLAESRHLRRVLPVHLVQALSSMNFLEAAEFLGVPLSWITEQPLRLQPLVPQRDLKGHDLPDTLEHLARHIAGQEKIDYRARRTRFADWHLDDQTWDRLRQQYSHGRPSRKPTAATRESASAYAWSRVTSSEYSLAPVFQPPLSPPDRRLTATSAQMTLLWSWDRRNRYVSFPGLLETLDALADQITGTEPHTR